MSRRAKRAIIGTAVSVGAIGVLLGGAAVALNVINANRGPEGVVQEYLAHLANGDAAAATAMVPVPPDLEYIIDNDVFAADGVQHIVVGEVTSEVQDDSGMVSAEITLGDAEYTVFIAVSAGESDYGLLRTWVIDNPLVHPAQVWAIGSDEVTIAGSAQTLSPYFDGHNATFMMYPAIYPVTLESDSIYRSGDAQSLVVAPGRNGVVSLQASLTDDVKDEILAQVQDFVTACTEVPTNMDYDCPAKVKNKDLASLEVTTQVSDVAWIDEELLHFETDSATITILRNPTAAVPNPKPEEIVFEVYGTFTITGDVLEIDIDHAW